MQVEEQGSHLTSASEPVISRDIRLDSEEQDLCQRLLRYSPEWAAMYQAAVGLVRHEWPPQYWRALFAHAMRELLKHVEREYGGLKDEGGLQNRDREILIDSYSSCKGATACYRNKQWAGTIDEPLGSFLNSLDRNAFLEEPTLKPRVKGMFQSVINDALAAEKAAGSWVKIKRTLNEIAHSSATLSTLE